MAGTQKLVRKRLLSYLSLNYSDKIYSEEIRKKPLRIIFLSVAGVHTFNGLTAIYVELDGVRPEPAVRRRLATFRPVVDQDVVALVALPEGCTDGREEAEIGDVRGHAAKNVMCNCVWQCVLFMNSAFKLF